MRRIALIAAGLLLLAGLGRAGVASAQTAGVQGTLYTPGGSIFGTVSVGTDGANNTVLTFSVTHGQPSATYAVCLTDPAAQQLSGQCTPTSLAFGTPIVASPFGCSVFIVGAPCAVAVSTPSNAIGQMLTDTQGRVNTTFTVPGTLSTAVVVVWNVANPSDTAQAVVITGLAGTGLVGTGAGFGFICPTFNGFTC
jgi:hypothetical protein